MMHGNMNIKFYSQLTSHWHLLLSEYNKTGINLRLSAVYLCHVMNVSHVCVNLNAHPVIVHFTRDSEADGADAAAVLQQLLWSSSHWYSFHI